MSGYWQATVIIDGALDSEDNLTDRQLSQLRSEIELHARAHPKQHVQVYALWHAHSDTVDCECAQYVQDGRPLDNYEPKETK